MQSLRLYLAWAPLKAEALKSVKSVILTQIAGRVKRAAVFFHARIPIRRARLPCEACTISYHSIKYFQDCASFAIFLI